MINADLLKSHDRNLNLVKSSRLSLCLSISQFVLEVVPFLPR